MKKTEIKLAFKAFDYGQADFSRLVRGAVRRLWYKSNDEYEFVSSMISIIRRGYTLAFAEGARSVGILPAEYTLEEHSRRNTEIASQYQYIMPYAVAIMSVRDRGGKISDVFARAQMWVNRYETVRSIARIMAGKNKKIKWVLGNTLFHCRDCSRLNGKVYRASIWKKYNLFPRARHLECKGYKCQCRHEITQDPCTPGHPPMFGVI